MGLFARQKVVFPGPPSELRALITRNFHGQNRHLTSATPPLKLVSYPGLAARRYSSDLIAVLLVEVAAMLRTIWLGAAVVFLLLVSHARGDGLPATSEPAAPTIEQIAALIEQFDQPGFTERQAASQRLEEIGVAALPQLESTAASGKREAAGRSLDILKRHFQQGSEDTKAAAREALVRLAQSENSSTAQRARNVLNPPKETNVAANVGLPPGMPPPVNFGGFGGRGGGGFGGGGFGGGFGGNFGGGFNINRAGDREISRSDINGHKSLTIDDRERKVKIASPPGGGIHVEVTDKLNGRDRRIDAKDVDDLKHKDAELGRLYEQFMSPAQGQIGGFGPAAPPFGFGGPAPQRGATIHADLIKRNLESIDTFIERYKQRLPRDPTAQRMIDSLERSKQQFRDLLPAGEATRRLR